MLPEQCMNIYNVVDTFNIVKPKRHVNSRKHMKTTLVVLEIVSDHNKSFVVTI